MEPCDIAAAFNACINGRDLDGLTRLMTDDHVFVDAAGWAVCGKVSCVAAWQKFFAAFPDYRNELGHMSVAGDEVTIVGRSVCADARLAGPALWTARITSELVAAWRVYEDTPSNRQLLGLK